MERLIKHCIKYMHDYQKKNNTTSMCVTNTQYLRDTIVCSNLGFDDVKAITVFVVGNKEKYLVIHAHLMVEVDGSLYDPSYETDSYEEKRYFFNFKEMVDYIILECKGDYPMSINDILIDNQFQFYKLQSIADRINNNVLCITDNDYYDKQHDYVMSK